MTKKLKTPNQELEERLRAVKREKKRRIKMRVSGRGTKKLAGWVAIDLSS